MYSPHYLYDLLPVYTTVIRRIHLIISRIFNFKEAIYGNI
nr:MAG TPA: hypothetical protein [Caudoviricetes sp.]